MKRQKINCSGNRSRRKFRGKKTLFLNLGKEVISVYQRNDHPQKTSSYPINTSRIYRSPPVPYWSRECNDGRSLEDALPGLQHPPKLLLLPKCSRHSRAHFPFPIQGDLSWPHTMAEALAQSDQYLWTGTGWEFLVEKLLSGKASVSWEILWEVTTSLYNFQTGPF